MTDPKRASRTAAFARIHAGQRADDVSPIPLMIRRFTNAYGRLADAALRKDAGLTLARFTILSTLESEPGISGAALADLTGQRAQSLSETVASLEAEGHIERRGGRGRERLHFLTPAGAALLEPARLRLRAVQRDVLGGLTEAQRKALEATLDALLDRLD